MTSWVLFFRLWPVFSICYGKVLTQVTAEISQPSVQGRANLSGGKGDEHLAFMHETIRVLIQSCN